MKNQFSSGNYNSWEDLVNITLPQINKEIRGTIIPTLDKTLVGMLGYRSEEGIEKKSIDVSQIFDESQITGVKYEILYFVDEFQAPEAPKEAVEDDCNTISDAISTEKIKVSEINIDTDKGLLKITFDITFEEYDGDKAGISE